MQPAARHADLIATTGSGCTAACYGCPSHYAWKIVHPQEDISLEERRAKTDGMIENRVDCPDQG